jgi:hypothetical protein
MKAMKVPEEEPRPEPYWVVMLVGCFPLSCWLMISLFMNELEDS